MARRDLDSGRVHRWLDAYGRAWEDRDPRAVARLFTDDASYQLRPSPFAGPLQGRKAILDYWRWSTDRSTDVSFEYEVLDAAGERGAARWSAWIREQDTVQRVDGIFVVELSEGDRCASLLEWWNTGQRQPP